MSDLIQKKCVPCEGKDIRPYTKEEAENLLAQVPGWQLKTVEEGLKPSSTKSNFQIIHEFKFKDFKEAMKFVNKVAELAEAEGHHPNIKISYSEVTLELYTHAINGLSENDFIVAAKINKL